MTRLYEIIWITLIFASVATSMAGNAINTNYVFDSIRSDDPNYFAYAKPLDDGALDLDEQHMEFSISLKYPLLKTIWSGNRLLMPNRLLFIYNGLYDFYMLPTGNGIYGSAPIISRRQNPGVALEWDTRRAGQWRLGYFHESNGQSVSDTNSFSAVMAAAENSETYAVGQTSRGWDYATIRYAYDTRYQLRENINSNGYLRGHLDLRHFFELQGGGSTEKEDDIFWKTSNESPKISDYDGLRAMLEGSANLSSRFGFIQNTGVMTRLELKTGISDLEALENIGGRVTFAIKPALTINGCPFFTGKQNNTWISFFYFNGYGREPSSYHYRTEYVGIGIEMR